MPWFKVDDQLHSHKKAMRAGTQAMGLWLLAGSWSAGHLTDGFVPAYVVCRLDPADGDDLAKRLERADLWEAGTCDGDEGWWFKDWREFNPTADEVEAKREAGRERQERSRRHRAGDHSKCLPEHCEQAHTGDEPATDTEGHDPVTRDEQRPGPSRPQPTPEPLELHADESAPPPADTFEEFWDRYPRHDTSGKPGGGGSKAKSRKLWDKLEPDEREVALVGVGHYADFQDREDAPFTCHATTWLNERRWETWQEPAAKARGSPGTRDVSEFDGQTREF